MALMAVAVVKGVKAGGGGGAGLLLLKKGLDGDGIEGDFKFKVEGGVGGGFKFKAEDGDGGTGRNEAEFRDGERFTTGGGACAFES